MASIYTTNEPFDISLSNDISNDVIIIDTSENRIGVNIMDPHYSIDVRDFSDVSGIIYTDYLKTGAIISSLTPNTDVCYNLGSQDKKWNEIHANYLEVSGIKIKDASQFILGSGTGGDAIVFPSDISVNGDISCVNLNVDGITIKDASKFSIGGGTSDTNGIEFMANTTIAGNLTITGNINSSYISSLLTGTNDVNVSVINNTNLNNQDVYSKYKGDTLLTSYTKDAGFNPDYNRVLKVVSGGISYQKDPGWVHSVSSTYTVEYPKDNIMDNNVSTKWAAYSTDDDEWVIFDFGTLKNILGLRILNEKLNLSQFTFEIGNSTDINNFTAIKTFDGILEDLNTTSTDLVTNEFILPYEITSRYVRLSNIKAANNKVPGFTEIDFLVFDTAGPFSYQQNIDWPYSATSEHVDYPFSNIMDGNINTFWSTTNHDYGNETITFNLQTIKDVYGIKFTIPEFRRLNQFTLQTSNDNTTYTVFDTFDDYHSNPTGTAGPVTFDIDFTNVITTQYIRLSNLLTYGGDVRISDIQFKIRDVKYLIDNQLSPDLSLSVDTSYVFDLTDVSTGFPFNIFTDADNSNSLYSGATVDGSFLYLTVDSETSTLYYNSSQNVSMGGQIDIIPSTYQNMNVKFIADTNNIVRSDINEYNRFNLVTNDFNKSTTSSNTNLVNINGILAPEANQYYNIRSTLNLDVVNAGSHDVSLDFVIFKNNNVIHSHTLSVNSDTTISNRDINLSLSQIKLLNNDTINLGFLTYIEDSSASGLNSASAVSYQSLGIDLNFNGFYIEVDKFKPPASNYNYDINIKNNTILNNQDVYSKYKGDTLLTSYTNQNVGFNPDYNRVLKVVSGGTSYQKDSTWPVEASADYGEYTVDKIMDDDGNQWAVNITGTHWVRFDIDEAKTIVGLKITSEQRRISRFTFQTSSEANNNWNDIETFDLGDVPENGTEVTNEFILSNAITARYIRLYDIKGIGSFFERPGIIDMEFLVFDNTDYSSYQQNIDWPVSASSNNTNQQIQASMDGATNNWWSSASNGPESINFDLKSIKTITGFKLIAPKYRLDRFTLQARANNTDTWDEIETYNSIFGQEGDGNDSTPIAFEVEFAIPITARYVKLNQMFGWPNNTAYHPRINDIQFKIRDVKYLIDNQLTPDLSLSVVDTSYVFDLTDVSTGFPFNIFTDADNSNSLYSGATVDGSFLYLTVDSETSTLYYNSSEYPDSGGQIDIIPSTYQNMNVKFIADTNQIIRSDLNEYNKFNLVTSDFNRVSTSGYVNNVDLCGVIISMYDDNYSINSLLNLDVTNSSSYDVSLDFVLLHNNTVIPNTHKTISVLANTTVTNQDISTVLSGVTLFENDTLNLGFLTYIEDSSASGLNIASAVSYQSLAINLNVNSLNISVEKLKPTTSDYNYDIAVINNTNLNNQDVYSKYKGDTLLTSYTNQDVGFNPDNNRVLKVVTAAQHYLQDSTWVHSVSSAESDYPKNNIMDDHNVASTRWIATSTGPEWVLFDFQKPRVVAGFTLLSNENRFVEFTFEISETTNDNDFIPIQSFTGVQGNYASFFLTNPVISRYIRLNNVYSMGTGNVELYDLKFNIFDTISDTNQSYYQKDPSWPHIASNEHYNYPLSNTMDGDINTFWSTDNQDYGNETITFDLQSIKSVYGIKFTLPQYRRLTTFTLQTSDNNISYTTVETFNQFNNNPNGTAGPVTFTIDFNNVAIGQYIRLSYLLTGGGVDPRISDLEFKILGSIYLIDNQLTPDLSLSYDTSYVFDLTNVSSSFPFNIYTQPDNSNNPYSGATIDGSFLYLTVDSDTSTLYYNSSQNLSMGGTIDIIPSNYQNVNVKFISDTNQIVRTDLNEYNRFNLVSSDFNKSSTTGYVNYVDLCGVIIAENGDNYSINSLLSLDVTNNSSYDVSLDFVLLQNNSVIPNTQKTISVLSNTSVTNQDISSVLAGLTLFENDTINYAFLTYVQDSSASGLNSASAVSYQSLEINLSVNSLNISVEKLKPTPQNYIYDINVMNNANLNNTDVYSKYKGDSLLTSYTNQDVGFNPDYNRVFEVVSGGISYQKDINWPVAASSVQTTYYYSRIMDGEDTTQWMASSVGPQSVTFDIQSVKTILGIKIYTWDSEFGKFTLETSDDGTSYTTIETFDQFNLNPSNATFKTFTFDLSNAIITQHIRLNNIYSSVGYEQQWPRIFNLEFLIFDTTISSDKATYQQNSSWPHSATSYNINYPIQNTMDDDINTFWSTYNFTQGQESITFNLEKSRFVYGIQISVPEYRRLTEFTLQTSNDDISYTTIETFDQFNNNPTGTGQATFTIDFNNVVIAQYIRLGNIYTGYGDARISDLEFRILDFAYLIDNQPTPDLSLSVDTSYVFDLTNVSSSYPFNIYTQPDNSNNPYSGATIDGSFLYLTVDSDTSTLYYNSSQDLSMGGTIDIINKYQNFNVKFIADTNQIVRSDLNEYNKFNLVTSDFNKVSASGYVNNVDLCGVIIAGYGQYYNINSLLNLDVTNSSSYDVSLDFVLLQNNSVIPNTQKTISVLANTTVTNQEISSQLAGVTLFKNDTINYAFLTYIQDSSASGLNSASAVSYQSLGINLNVNSLNISVSAPLYEELQVTNLDGTNINVENINIKNTLTLNSDIPTSGDSIVFDGNKLTWKNAIIDVRELIINSNITQRSNTAIGGLTNTSYLGTSCAMSADGNRLIVGGGGHSTWQLNSKGMIAVYDFSYSISEWVKVIEQEGGDGSNRGCSVDITPDGSKYIVGSPNIFRQGAGEVAVYEIDVGATGIPRGDNTDDRKGSSVSISSDGNTVAVGSFSGFPAYIYEYQNGGWQESFIYDAGSRPGASVKLSDDGNVFVFSDPTGGGGEKGIVYIYRKNVNGGWSQEKIIYGNNDYDNLGHALTLSANGNLLVASAFRATNTKNQCGGLAIYRYDGLNWNNILGGNNYFFAADHGGVEQEGGNMGMLSVSVSYNGDELAVGDFWDGEFTNSGSVQIYKWNGSAYELVDQLYGETGNNGYFGSSVALSDNGKYLAVGEYQRELGYGRVFTYELKTESIPSGQLYYNRSDYVLRVMP